MSTPRISDLNPEQVFVDDEVVEKYKKYRKAMWDGLVQLHNNVLLIRGISHDYPGRLLQRGGPAVGMMIRSTYELSLIVAHRLLNDRDPKAASLPNLRTFVRRNIRPELLPELDSIFGKTKPDATVRDALRRLKLVRDQYYAHRDLDPEDMFLPGIKDLELLDNAALAMYNSTGISTTAFLGLLETTDLYAAFDEMALRSFLSTSFDERDPEYWERHIRVKYTSSEIEAMNAIRARHGLPAIE